MKKKLQILSLLLMVCLLLQACSSIPHIPLPGTEEPDIPPTAAETPAEPSLPPETATPEPVPSPTPTVSPTAPATPSPSPDPAERVYTLSFAGDCTLGSQIGKESNSNSFISVVGTNYAHPFKNVQEYFGKDDFTLVNLEGTFTNSTQAADKEFTFRADPRFASCLTVGSVECVSIVNNHSKDFGETGYKDTIEALRIRHIAYASYEDAAIYSVDERLKIGVIGLGFYIPKSRVDRLYQQCKDAGCNLIIAAFHWGKEGYYQIESTQAEYAHYLIDMGCDAVVGHHPHVLQKTEAYKGKPIFYSLGNFSFGGNANPKDRDTVVAQMHVRVLNDGSIQQEGTTLIPCCLSSTPRGNDYCPTPYPENSEDYFRCLSKLDGTYRGPNIPRQTPTPVPASQTPTPSRTPASGTQTPDPTPAPATPPPAPTDTAEPAPSGSPDDPDSST
ncbi:MAG: CapA family protein [Clostridia bacterium]|nr:CapA family protein [Clostridia bacterium]